MKINKCILDDANDFAVGASTVGALISSAGKRHLWEARADGRVDTVVIHYMSAVNICPGDPYNVGQVLKIFCDYGVSSHYLITRRGKIFSLVPEEMKAWHAGLSIMPEPDNRKGVNEFSIGIELLATEASGFTKLQYGALSRLCADIEKRHHKKMTYVGHDQIAGERAVALGVRKDAKIDPGPLFNWSNMPTTHRF
ncbi:MAG: N-acetylmuramoyl-L-alanine amidase [Chitinispirillales bacterium]|jgi:N-acetyl-anhydromuramyl-L-alanine amidase AmpD|nr:N-acetylmuramoyl-L-alanine amidase [Chitinispirillales bacterium]